MVRGPQHVLGCKWAGGFARLANGHKKTGFPHKITGYEDGSGKHREKGKKHVMFFIRVRIYFIIIQIIKMH